MSPVEQRHTEIVTDDKGNPTTQPAEVQRPEPDNRFDGMIHLYRAIRSGLGTGAAETHLMAAEKLLPQKTTEEANAEEEARRAEEDRRRQQDNR